MPITTTPTKKPPTATSNKINNPSYRLALTIAAIAATAATALLLMPTAIQAAYADGPTSQLTVTSRLENGTDITGYFTSLSYIDEVTGDPVEVSDFTPSHFTVNSGQDYTLSAGSYGNVNFTRWFDTGSTDPIRTVNINSDTEFVAIYNAPQPQNSGSDNSSGDGGSGEGNGDPAPSAPAGGVTYSYVQGLAKRASVYAGGSISASEDDSNGASFAPATSVPDINLSGYVLPDGSQIMSYTSIYDLLTSGMDLSTTMRAAELAGINWDSLSEAQQCYLAIVLNTDIPLDENGLPVQNPA